MSKFDAMRASGEMMPTAMGTAAMDGKNSSSKTIKFNMNVARLAYDICNFYEACLLQ